MGIDQPGKISEEHPPHGGHQGGKDKGQVPQATDGVTQHGHAAFAVAHTAQHQSERGVFQGIQQVNHPAEEEQFEKVEGAFGFFGGNPEYHRSEDVGDPGIAPGDRRPLAGQRPNQLAQHQGEHQKIDAPDANHQQAGQRGKQDRHPDAHQRRNRERKLVAGLQNGDKVPGDAEKRRLHQGDDAQLAGQETETQRQHAEIHDADTHHDEEVRGDPGNGKQQQYDRQQEKQPHHPGNPHHIKPLCLTARAAGWKG